MRRHKGNAKTPEKSYIDQIVYDIYSKAIHASEQTDDSQTPTSRYIYKLPRDGSLQYIFYKTHLPEIVNNIQNLFPDCFVEYTTIAVVCTRDGKRYDVSKIGMNIIPGITKPIPCIRRPVESDEYIVIDWS